MPSSYKLANMAPRMGDETEAPLLSREPGTNEGSDSDLDDFGSEDTLFSETHDDIEEAPQDDQFLDQFSKHPFQPFDDLPDESRNILTLRAILVGLLCGGLVNSSNIYLGLKSGWTASANIFASIVGFAVLKFAARYFHGIPYLGDDFGPRENNIVQTTATAAGGMSNVFTSAFPAMYQLGLLDTPINDYWRIITLTAVGGYLGIFFATPLRKFFIIYVAEELHLIFPSSTATAITIRSMHLAAEGKSLALRKMRALSWAFAAAAGLRVLSQYAMGLLWDWHPFTWFFLLSGGHIQSMMAIESWGWRVQWSPAFMGSGMLAGLNVSASYYIGSILAWGIVGPVLVAKGLAFGQTASQDPFWSSYMGYNSLTQSFTTADHPSPRYWLLWPGVLGMVVVSFTELLCQWRIFWLTGKVLWRSIVRIFKSLRASNEIRPVNCDEIEEKNHLPGGADETDIVTMWMWFPGLIAVVVLSCIVMRVQYDMPVQETILALFLTAFFSFLAIQSTGATDITPLTAASKASQIVLGAATKDQGWTVSNMQRMNLLGGALASVGASQAADLVGDFRVGFLLRTSPRLQWFAQAIGTLFAVFLAPAIYVLFSIAYPCINDAAATSCAFDIPSVSAWRAVAVAVTDPEFPIPASSRTFSIIFAIFGSAMVLVRHCLWTGKWECMRSYHPNMMVVSLAFIIPATVYGLAMLMGAILAQAWSRRNPKSFGMYGYGVAAGFMAGEGIGGVVNAVIQILGISGDVYGSTILCPAGIC